MTAPDELPPYRRPELELAVPPLDDGFERMRRERETWHRADRIARRKLDQEEADSLAEPRVRRTAAEYSALPQPESIMDRVLPSGPALLGGPEGGGKSMLARDWALHVATGTPWLGHRVARPRAVLYVMDEGMHDFGDRWSSSPLWEPAKNKIFTVAEPVNLLSSDDVGRLLDEYRDVAPGLTIFDTIYGMGMPDDTGVAEVAPVIDALKLMAATWNGCTLAIGHAGHNHERRFRGSSMWRQRTDVDWHMAENRLSCERSKIADKLKLTRSYELEYPNIRWLDPLEKMSIEAQRHEAVREDSRRYPGESYSARARRLAPHWGVSEKTVVRFIKNVEEIDGVSS